MPVNDEALSGLVSESSGLFRSSWLGSSVDGVEVSVLPDTNSKKMSFVKLSKNFKYQISPEKSPT